jgi:hypothetical protein
MRILIDECPDERLRSSFSGQTACYAGFAGLENGQLLSAAESVRFGFVNCGPRPRIRAESSVKFAIIIFHAKSIRLKDLLPHIPACLALLPYIKPDEIVRIPDNPS